MINHNHIRILENSVIDQIAAGEVVDRPAHMIKELCENSLDAGATELYIDFEKGGRSVLIRDNGQGILPEELPLTVARHATSKISKSDDLWEIATYGFRGEALASIGAVSRLEITSRAASCKMGAQLRCHFGEVSKANEAGSEIGTTVQVFDLFQNVPARLKFLKTDAGESSAIKTQLKAVALANPNVSIRVLQEGKLLYYWPSTDGYKKRVEQVLELSNMYEGAYSLDQYKAEVVVSSPNETTGNSRQIWFFVQGRYVQDRSLQAAVMDAYRNLLMHGEYPTAVVYLTCNPNDLDVNVSPTKSQVKFREPSQAFRVVQRAVRGVLEAAPWLKNLLGSDSLVSTSNSKPEMVPLATSISSPLYSEENSNLSFSSFEFDKTQYQVKDSSPKFKISEVRDVLSQASGEWSKLEVLGQAHMTYIITQKSDAILFIDQHAAHERVLFETLMAGYIANGLEIQNFLLAQVVKLGEEEVQEILKIKSHLEKMGLYLDQISPDEIAIQAAPSLVKSEALSPMMKRLAEECVERGGSFHIEKIIGDMMASLACHSAIRAGQALSHSEMVALLQQMDEYPLSSFCPHGRPVFVEYPIRKLERDFGRIV